MKKIREEKALTYGIYSTAIHTLNESFWMISSEMQKEKTDQGLFEINNEILTLAKNPPDQKEVDVLKSYLKGKLLSSTRDICWSSKLNALVLVI